jgi:hypothetical protein
MRYHVKLMLAGVLLLCCALPLSAQVVIDEDEWPSLAPLRVFLDCATCNFDYIRQEIPFVDYVRERQDGQLHILVTQQATAGGGRQYVLNFIGTREFAGQEDTLRYISPQGDSDELRRRGLVRVMKLGLMRFVANTPASEGIQITYGPTVQRTAATQQRRDPWNYWTFRIGASGNVNGESSRDTRTINGSMNANRTTELWKTNLRTNGRYNEQNFTLSTGSRRVINRNWGVDATTVRSVGNNMAVGLTSNVSSSIFSNYRLAMRVAPAFEYNVFPYSEATRRQLLMQYSVGAAMLDYAELTIYDRTEETLVHQALAVSYSVQQPWGSASVTAQRSNYFHDAGFNRLQFDGGFDINVIRGLSVNFSGNYSRINDQLSLPRRNASDEDVLVSRRQLETSFRYRANVGASYRFGSMFNNIVNPRLAAGGIDF